MTPSWGITVYCCCSCMMHFLSALTHVYPDDIYLEKLDHLGIVSLVMGTPISTLLVSPNLVPGRHISSCLVRRLGASNRPDQTVCVQVRYPGDPVHHLAAIALAMVIAAFLRPTSRTLSFGAGVMYIYITNFWRVHSINMAVEVLLYSIGGVFFIRCGFQSVYFFFAAASTLLDCVVHCHCTYNNINTCLGLAHTAIYVSRPRMFVCAPSHSTSDSIAVTEWY